MMYKVAVGVVSTFLALYGIRKLRERKWGSCRNRIDLSGKVVLITGANSGLGYEACKELASRGAKVILACRNLVLANAAIEKITTELGNPSNLKLVAMELDLCSLDSVKKFADEIIRIYPKIHILINNAGVSFPRNQLHFTKDQFEIHFGVNYLGHFLLTNLLLDTLKQSSPCRIINVSSTLYERGEIFLGTHQDLDLTKLPKLYANSKLAIVYFTQELARRLKDYNINVYAVCPGWVLTNLFRHSFKWFHYILIAPIALFFMRTPKQGVQTIVYCATEPSLDNESGLMYRDCKLYKSKFKFDDETALKLWEYSENAVKEKLISP